MKFFDTSAVFVILAAVARAEHLRENKQAGGRWKKAAIGIRTEEGPRATTKAHRKLTGDIHLTFNSYAKKGENGNNNWFTVFGLNGNGGADEGTGNQFTSMFEIVPGETGASASVVDSSPRPPLAGQPRAQCYGNVCLGPVTSEINGQADENGCLTASVAFVEMQFPKQRLGGPPITVEYELVRQIGYCKHVIMFMVRA